MAYQPFMGYLMLKPSTYNNGSHTIYPVAVRIKGFLPFLKVSVHKWTF